MAYINLFKCKQIFYPNENYVYWDGLKVILHCGGLFLIFVMDGFSHRQNQIIFFLLIMKDGDFYINNI